MIYATLAQAVFKAENIQCTDGNGLIYRIQCRVILFIFKLWWCPHRIGSSTLCDSEMKVVLLIRLCFSV